MRVPVQVTALRPGAVRLSEKTVIEYGAEEHAIFMCAIPLEFDDRVRLERMGTAHRSPVEATVTAVQYHEGRKAVAVRFLTGPSQWVMEP